MVVSTSAGRVGRPSICVKGPSVSVSRRSTGNVVTKSRPFSLLNITALIEK